MLLIGIALSFFITFITLPIIIRLFRSINLMDAPDRRKVHKLSKPSLGGISIYMGVITAMIFVIPFELLAQFKFFIAGIMITFLLGMRDDISSLLASQKLIFQLLAAFITVHYAGISLDSFYGIFGLEGSFPEWLSITFSMFILIGISNAFNLIDGIDGLAGSLALIASVVFGAWFFAVEDMFFAHMSFMVASGLVAFLIFNWQPAKIFMGDTGSLVTGFILGVFAIRFISLQSGGAELPYIFDNFVPVAVSLIIVPVYDTARVMIIRLSQGISPFFPDRSHIHHTLIRQGFSHGQSTLLIVGLTLSSFLLVSQLTMVNDTLLLIINMLLVVSFGLYFDHRLRLHLKRERAKASEERSMYISKSA